MSRGILSAILTGSALLAFAGNTDPDEVAIEEVEATMSVLENIISIDEDYLNGVWKAVAESETVVNSTRYTELTEADFRQVADELGVEIAAIKAVVEIEAGREMQGFWAPGIPVINFDPKMYARLGATAASKAGAKGEKVPAGLSGYALREWTQLINARKNNAQGANLGTFWGMFQIGGFNYRQCGCESVDEFVKLMSYSELEQLELFAAFITNSGMLEDLRNKNWAAFARKYNGAGYKKRGYDTKMAAAYKKFKAAE